MRGRRFGRPGLVSYRALPPHLVLDFGMRNPKRVDALSSSAELVPTLVEGDAHSVFSAYLIAS
jgi:hypothetical protein